VTADFPDERLEVVLASVGHHLEVPPALPEPALPELALPELVRPEPVWRRRRSLAAVAVAAVVVCGVLLVPSTRSAVADLLGIGSTRIEIAPGHLDDPGNPGDPGGLDGEESLAHIAEGLAPISPDQARALLDSGLPDTSATVLGPPQTIHAMPEGGVLLAWSEGSATLWVRNSVLPETEVLTRKLVESGQDVEVVDGLGTAALFVSSPHILQTPQRRVAAGAVLLWHEDDRDLRLEADLTRTEMIDLARTMSLG
jgi:hypothetical protein